MRSLKDSMKFKYRDENADTEDERYFKFNIYISINYRSIGDVTRSRL